MRFSLCEHARVIERQEYSSNARVCRHTYGDLIFVIGGTKNKIRAFGCVPHETSKPLLRKFLK